MPVGQPSPDNSSTSNQVSQTYHNWQIKKDDESGIIKLSKEVHLNGRSFKVTIGYNTESLTKPENELDQTIKGIIDYVEEKNILENQIGPMMKESLPGERLVIKHDQSSQEGTTIRRSWSSAISKTEEETFSLDKLDTKNKRFENTKELVDILQSSFIRVKYSDQHQSKEDEKNKEILKSKQRAESPADNPEVRRNLEISIHDDDHYLDL